MVPALTGITLDHLKFRVLWGLAHTNLLKGSRGDNILGLVVIELSRVKDDLLLITVVRGEPLILLKRHNLARATDTFHANLVRVIRAEQLILSWVVSPAPTNLLGTVKPLEVSVVF